MVSSFSVLGPMLSSVRQEAPPEVGFVESLGFVVWTVLWELDPPYATYTKTTFHWPSELRCSDQERQFNSGRTWGGLALEEPQRKPRVLLIAVWVPQD